MRLRLLALCVVVFFMSFAFLTGEPAKAADGVTSMPLFSAPFDYGKVNTTEIGMTFSSLNRGSTFTTLALSREFGDWFTGGVRALVPAQFLRDTQIYAVQAYGRFPLVNNENVIYFEPQVSQGYFTGLEESRPFMLIGAAYGYTRRFNGSFTAGVNMGVDYSNSRIMNDGISADTDQRSLYSRVGITGGYYF